MKFLKKQYLGILAAVGVVQMLIMFGLSYFDQMHHFYLRDYQGKAIVMITDRSERAGGTGFAIQYNGKKYLMTNEHVCEIRKFLPGGLWTRLPDGKKVKLKVLKTYSKHDLCLLEQPEKMHSLSVGSKLTMGQMAYVIGYPALQPKTLTQGEYVGDAPVEVLTKQGFITEVICKKSEIRIEEMGQAGCVRLYTASYTTTPIVGGSSGSPLLNFYGQVVGVVFAGSPYTNNWAKAVPFESLVDFLESYQKEVK